MQQYESATDAVLEKLDVELIDIPEFNCCGYPLKNSSMKAYVLSSVRNLSIAESKGLNIMTLCNCCYGSLKQADLLMQSDPAMNEEINTILQKEGLQYNTGVEVRHMLDVLYQDIGLEAIRQKIIKTVSAVKIASHYGCHIFRPKEITPPAITKNPDLFDQLIEITGADCVDWKTRDKCCGASARGINDELAMDLTEAKISDARQAGAEYFCVTCVFCQLQFDRGQKMLCQKRGQNESLPSILYPQLLGLSLGIDQEILGIHQNELSISGILDCLR
jgi:heterodisulfide reductase subunit B